MADHWPPAHHVWKQADSLAWLDKLSCLEDGWRDGEGVAPDATKMESLISCFKAWWTDNHPQPIIAPNPNGNIKFSWHFEGASVETDVILSNGMMWFRCADKPGSGPGSGYEEMIDITSKEGWDRLAGLLAARPTNNNYLGLVVTT